MTNRFESMTNVTVKSSTSGITYKGWYVAALPEDHKYYPGNHLVIVEDGGNINPMVWEKSTEMEVIAFQDKKLPPEGVKELAIYFQGYQILRDDYLKMEVRLKAERNKALEEVKDLTEQLDVMRESNVLALAQLAQDREAMEKLQKGILLAYQEADKLGYADTAKDILIVAGLPVPVEQEYEITVKVVGHATLNVKGTSMEQAVAFITDGEVEDAMLHDGTVESWELVTTD